MNEWDESNKMQYHIQIPHIEAFICIWIQIYMLFLTLPQFQEY